ncbi:threonine/homoserine/homoserine lactone efflux protein [Clostridium algifaecis]|uniref:Threonine/homoserine/homoserine lactone efflux protein n=1 Tax=Clostridium algifaecis TaxID=1472040 RepID=A0ABS4KRT3_9CLOT|nr:LysE family transporter [Clostridium algifaecis]MBP2032746.1 threonine/homoserine/homoserine lactone efflux protein [Clostridium algifaecis]
MLKNLFRGILIGLITGMPLGPIGAICLKNTISFGRKYGLISGLGSAITDSIYAGLAALGFILIEKFIILHKFYFHILGGLMLISFGMYTFLNEKNDKVIKTTNKTVISVKNISSGISPLKVFSSTFLIALANPATIFSFISVFTGLHMAQIQDNIKDKIFMILGVFIGSMIWWLILVFTAVKFNNKLNRKNTSIISKILSLIIVFSGLFIFLGAFNRFTMHKSLTLHSKLFELFFNIKTKIPFHKFR